MPPKEPQSFDFETMAIVLYALGKGGVKLGGAHYKMMSDATNGARGPDSFNHQFRAVKKRADELAAGSSDTPPPKKAKPATPASGKKRSESLEDDLHESARY